MIRLTRTLFLLISLAASLDSVGQALWQGTAYGMSLNEVRAVHPEGKTPSSPVTLATEAKEMLRIENFELVKKSFDVHFYFLDEELIQVTLSLQDSKTSEDTLRTFDSVREALAAKYGNPIKEESSGGELRRKAADWRSDRTDINLLAYTGGGLEVLNINYQVRVALEADKL